MHLAGYMAFLPRLVPFTLLMLLLNGYCFQVWSMQQLHAHRTKMQSPDSKRMLTLLVSPEDQVVILGNHEIEVNGRRFDVFAALHQGSGKWKLLAIQDDKEKEIASGIANGARTIAGSIPMPCLYGPLPELPVLPSNPAMIKPDYPQWYNGSIICIPFQADDDPPEIRS